MARAIIDNVAATDNEAALTPTAGERTICPGIAHNQRRTGSEISVTIEERLNIPFVNGALLVEALTHPSAVNEDPQAFSASNQRLEFLGDAFLDFLIAQELYTRLPQAPEGELTELRAAIVRGETLARVARNLSLGSFLHMGQGEESGPSRCSREARDGTGSPTWPPRWRPCSAPCCWTGGQRRLRHHSGFHAA